ncbi:MAG TPA: tetratricopeptide repeat protein [Bryobacteraceae bacterium]|nr:tetratricopeptide repeat protein [Bryobacteraceae bacterium]
MGGICLYTLLGALLVAHTGVAEDASSPTHALDRAYQSLRAKEYDQAIQQFQEALQKAPDNPAIRKDLAYALLRTGETLAARDQFAEALRLAPEDDHVALEYAFLAFETERKADARRIFNRLRQKGNVTAQEAFDRIDQALQEGIARWSRAVEMAPQSFSAHEELARLAEQRDEFDLAARHYRTAWELRPDRRRYLLDLGRVTKAAGRDDVSMAALLAASRGEETRIAEEARELLPARYPWVYEFRAALALDSGNAALHRELAWLLLEMGQRTEAEVEFGALLKIRPEDAWAQAQLGFLKLTRNDVDGAMPLLEQALGAADEELVDRVRATLQLPQSFRKKGDVPRAQASLEAVEMARRSLEAGYLKDALKYLRVAHENDPLDFGVMLQLGRTYNTLRQDREAVAWFGLARRSADPAQATEAARAFHGLAPQFAKFRTTAWMYPFYSSRWRDTFTYAQFRTELMPSWPVRPYFSLRFAGDTRRTAGAVKPGEIPSYLSESAFTPGLGLSTGAWNGVRGWAEAGYSFSYLNREDGKRIRPDVRGGLSWSRSSGRNFGASRPGLFLENTADLVFVSRFDNDTLLYSQNRAGWTLAGSPAAQIQITWNLNLTADARKFQWANSIETGPGIRLRLASLPSPVVLTLDTLDGRYTVLDGTRPPRYKDVRFGLWYAWTR